jgi:hypothetical protein
MPVCASEPTRLRVARMMNVPAPEALRTMRARMTMPGVPARLHLDELEPDDEQSDG